MKRLSALVAILAALIVPAAADAGGSEFAGGGLVRETGAHIVVYGRDFSVARLQPGGALDPTFGKAGLATASFPRYGEAHSFGASVQLGARTVVAGYVTVRCQARRRHACGRRVALVRFLSDGRLDPSFGGDGKVVTGWAGGASGVVVPDGRIVLAGRRGSGLPRISRLRFDGNPDPGFGDDGQIVLRRLPTGVALEDGRAERIAVQANGRILVSVYLNPVDGPNRYGLVRLTEDGRLDRSFGDGGFLLNPIGGRGLPGYSSGPGPSVDIVDHRFGFAPMPNGRILVSTALDEGGVKAQAGLVRLRFDGSPDLGFGVGGVGLAPESVDLRFGTSVIAAPDGGAYVGAAGFLGSYVFRFRPDGSLDPAFGPGGVATRLESWGARASIAEYPGGGVGIADDLRQTSGLLVGRFGADGAALGTTSLP